jgi:hypothetical protein
VAIYVLVKFAHNPLLLVIFSAFKLSGWGETYSLLPALCVDFFGRKHATENYGFLYTAKGTASMFVPIGSALAAGKAFDFRADILLLLGGVLVIFAVFLAPMALRLELGRNAKAILLVVAGVLITYGIVLTVVPTLWTPFAAKFTLPMTGWAGVFRVAIVFDLAATVLAFFPEAQLTKLGEFDSNKSAGRQTIRRCDSGTAIRPENECRGKVFAAFLAATRACQIFERDHTHDLFLGW